jgi:hypothetical protein
MLAVRCEIGKKNVVTNSAFANSEMLALAEL